MQGVARAGKGGPDSRRTATFALKISWAASRSREKRMPANDVDRSLRIDVAHAGGRLHNVRTAM